MQNNTQQFLETTNQVFNKDYVATIKLDMDDVIADFGLAWIELYNEKYNDNLGREDMIDWDATKFVKEECGMDIYNLFKKPGVFRYIKPTPHSKEVVSRLIEKGFEIVIVSDSPKGNSYCEFETNGDLISNPADDKRAWLAEHFPMISQDNIFFCKQKHRVIGDILVDDKPGTFEIHEKLGLNSILIDQPYNRYIKTEKRAKNLLEAEKMIYEMFLKKETC